MKATYRSFLFGMGLVLLDLCSGQASAQDNLHEESRILLDRLKIEGDRFVNCMKTYVVTQAERRLPREKVTEIAREKCGIRNSEPIVQRLSAINRQLASQKVMTRAEYEATFGKPASQSVSQPAASSPQKVTPTQKPTPTNAASNKQRIVSGNWAAGCAEQSGPGGLRVVCQRYGGFPDNRLPAGCADTGNLVCQNRSLCSLATDVTILVSDASPRLQNGIQNCPGHRGAYLGNIGR